MAIGALDQRERGARSPLKTGGIGRGAVLSEWAKIRPPLLVGPTSRAGNSLSIPSSSFDSHFRASLTVWICRLNITPTSPRLTPCLRFNSVEQVNQQTGKKDREYGIPVGSRPIADRRCDHENRPFENSNAGRLDSRRAGDSNLSSDDFRQSH